jgi:hypothetical protein
VAALVGALDEAARGGGVLDDVLVAAEVDGLEGAVDEWEAEP